MIFAHKNRSVLARIPDPIFVILDRNSVIPDLASFLNFWISLSNQWIACGFRNAASFLAAFLNSWKSFCCLKGLGRNSEMTFSHSPYGRERRFQRSLLQRSRELRVDMIRNAKNPSLFFDPNKRGSSDDRQPNQGA